MVEDFSIQRIVRLTPLSAILGLIEARVQAVTPRQCALAPGQGRTLAEDVVVAERPPGPIALRDGFAVAAAAIADAGPYAPAPFATRPLRVDVGDPLPRGADAVAPLDAINERGDRAEAIASVSPGEGVLPAGGDATPRTPLRRCGERLRTVDVAVLAAVGIEKVLIRAPRIRIVCGGAANKPPIDAALDILTHAITVAGGTPLDARNDETPFDGALAETGSDAVIAVGGTGSGRKDSSVRAVARLGQVEAHGIAVSPGEAAALGFIGARPVLLIPGRIDAALAVWLLIGRHLCAKLSGGSVEDAPVMMPLKRKIASTIGLAELMPVSCIGGMAEALASGYLSFESLTRSDGWIVIPADSEGLQVGTPIAVRAWP
jgi:molybdopterin biosynthesis enzyme